MSKNPMMGFISTGPRLKTSKPRKSGEPSDRATIGVPDRDQPRNDLRAPRWSFLSNEGKPASKTVAQFENEIPGYAEASEISSAAMKAGELVLMMREAADMTQTAVAEAAALTQPKISSIERGLSKDGPRFRTLLQIAAACDMEITAIPKDILRQLETGALAIVDRQVGLVVEDDDNMTARAIAAPEIVERAATAPEIVERAAAALDIDEIA